MRYATLDDAVYTLKNFIRSFDQVEVLFSTLFYGIDNFFAQESQGAQKYFSGLIGKIKAGNALTPYEKADALATRQFIGNNFPDLYAALKEDDKELAEFLEQLSSPTPVDTVIIEHATLLMNKTVPELNKILAEAGKDMQDLWQERANLWGVWKVNGLKWIERKNKVAYPAFAHANDREKFANKVAEKMLPKYSSFSYTIIEMAKGNLLFQPQNQKERRFYKAYLEARDKCFWEIEGLSPHFELARKKCAKKKIKSGKRQAGYMRRLSAYCLKIPRYLKKMRKNGQIRVCMSANRLHPPYVQLAIQNLNSGLT